MPMVAEDLIRYYLTQPYRISVTRRDADPSVSWLASIEELAGCEAWGATAEEAVSRIPRALADWVAGAQAAGREIPEPREARHYSGKLLVRMPQSLHAELARSAEHEQVSLNAYITGVLAAATSWRQAPPSAVEADADERAESDDRRRRQLLAVAVAVNLTLATILTLIVLLSATS
jgi:predicted HicB family RNase H-like nuclease